VLHQNLKDDYLYKIHAIIDYLGEITQPIFDLRDVIQDKHFKDTTNTKEAKHQWLKEYQGLHAPFDTQKKRIFGLLSDIEKR